jgi:23S rRNA (pseudouridine1915-N3)-methyltransferase
MSLMENPPPTNTKNFFPKLTRKAHSSFWMKRGKTIPSRTFAQKIDDIQNSGISTIQFMIGGADGLSDEIRARAKFLLGFGSQTWPHLLARVMLIEQIYRAQQILAGHPYHRD